MTDQQAPPASEQQSAGRAAVTISDPQAIRALAHEARLEALEELYSSQSTRTATELASRCGLTPSAMSYHLRALEKFGITKQQAGITAHGLRHGNLNDLYESLSGAPSPVRGGGCVDADADRAARLAVSERAGHARQRAAGAYIGQASPRQSAGCRQSADRPEAQPPA